MTVDEAIEQLQEIKKKESNAGSYLIGDGDAEITLVRFKLSSYDSDDEDISVDYVAYETDEWVDG